MKLLLSIVLATSFAFAGKVVPNIKWNKVERNETGAAAAMIDRNNVSLSSGRLDFDDDTHLSNTTASAIVAKMGVNAEVAIGKSFDSDSSTDSNEYSEIYLNIGKKINDKFIIGFNGSSFNTENDFGYNELGLSANFLMNKNIVFGAGVSRDHTNGSDLEAKTYYVGAGYINDKMAFELTFSEQPLESEGGSTRFGNRSLVINGTIHLNKFQLSPILRLSKSYDDEGSDDQEINSSILALESEFMINNQFFVGATLGASKQEDIDNNDNTNNYETTESFMGVMGRYKMNNLQFIARYDVSDSETTFEDGSSDTQSDDKTLTLTASYFF